MHTSATVVRGPEPSCCQRVRWIRWPPGGYELAVGSGRSPPPEGDAGEGRRSPVPPGACSSRRTAGACDPARGACGNLQSAASTANGVWCGRRLAIGNRCTDRRSAARRLLGAWKTSFEAGPGEQPKMLARHLLLLPFALIACGPRTRTSTTTAGAPLLRVLPLPLRLGGRRVRRAPRQHGALATPQPPFS